MKQILHLTISSGLKKCLLFGGLFLGLSTLEAIAAPSGMNYRTKQDGNWNDVNTWQRLDGTWKAITDPADIPDATAGTINILAGHIVTVNAAQTADQVTVNGTLVVNNGITLNIADDAGTTNDLAVNGILKNAGSVIPAATAKILIGATGTYQHNYTTTFGAIPTATWNITSTLEILGYTNPTGSPSGFNQSFANIRWNTTNATSDINLNGAFTSIVRGNFEVVSTNGHTLHLSADPAYNLTINGDLNIKNSSVLSISNGAVNGNTISLTLKRNLNIDGGATLTSANSASIATLYFSGTGDTLTNAGTLNTANMDITVSNNGMLTLKSPVSIAASRLFKVFGRLNMGTNIISGAGSFEVAVGTLAIGSADGITRVPATTGNIQVMGNRTFRVTSTYIYNGAVAQNTGNGLPATVAGLEVNNASGLTLFRNTTISAELKMTNGVLNPSGYTLKLNSNAIVTMPSGDNVSYVNGPLSLTVSTAATTTLNFPVGKNGVTRPVSLEITQLNADTTTYTVEQIAGAYPPGRTLPVGLDKVSSVRHYSITQSPAVGLNEGIITMNYGSDDGVADLGNLTIAKTTTTNSWIDLDGTTNLGSTTGSGSIVAFFTEFSDFALANKTGGNNPLPVELISFQATAGENAIALSWETASEKNSHYFAIERSSNALTFESVGQVNAAGNSQILKRYAFNDKNPLAGLAYYRLKQVDLDGTVAYSEIRTVKFQNSLGEAVLYPNPTTGKLTIEMPESADTKIEVMNLLGQVVYSGKFEGTKVGRLDLTHLPAATYQVRIIAANKQTVKKFVKAN